MSYKGKYMMPKWKGREKEYHTEYMRRCRQRQKAEREEVLTRVRAIPGFLDLPRKEQKAVERINQLKHQLAKLEEQQLEESNFLACPNCGTVMYKG